jgi:hypothetical protein
MDDFDLRSFLLKKIQEDRQRIAETMLDGLLTDMAHYKDLQGRLEVLKEMEQNIADYYKMDHI